MTEAAPRRWTVEEFFAWQEGHSERYELVDGFPMRMMAGAKNVHDDIVVNVLAELRNQLRGGGCRPFTSDGKCRDKTRANPPSRRRRRLRTQGPERNEGDTASRGRGGSLANHARLRHNRQA